MVLTKPELIGSLQNEVRILLHLTTKVDRGKLDYRPTPKQRSTLELLQYLTIMGPSLTNATLAIGLGATPLYLRLTRGLVLATGSHEYVQSARAMGAGDARVMVRHIFPNIVSALLVQATVSIPAAIIAEAILSFLGLGVQPPRPSWGTMLNTAQQFLEAAPWMAWWPGLAIFTLTLSFNLAGDGLRDWLDPKDY